MNSKIYILSTTGFNDDIIEDKFALNDSQIKKLAEKFLLNVHAEKVFEDSFKISWEEEPTVEVEYLDFTGEKEIFTFYILEFNNIEF